MEQIRAKARRYYGEGSAHGWDHVCRVEGLARRISDDEGADERVVRLGAVFHDIGREKESQGEVEDHASWGAEEARKVLSREGSEQDVIDSVVHCVETHRYSTGPEPQTTEASVVADADDLDALGAVGIARTFSHSADFDETAEHIRDKLLSLRDRMRTDTAREIAEDRHRFTAEFLERFERETY